MSGTWRRLPIDPPLSLLTGDEIIRIGETLVRQMRGAVVAERTLTLPGAVEDETGPVEEPITVTELFYFKEQPMPGVVATLTNVQVNNQTGSINFVFAGEGIQYSNFAELQSEEKIDEVVDLARKIIIQKTFRRSPDGANLSNMVGASCSIDLNADTPIVLTMPEE